MAGNYDFVIRAGCDWTQTLTWLSTGEPVNLTGYTARMQIRSGPGGTVYADISTAAAGITLGGEAGTVTLTIANAITSAWTWGTAYYDLLLTDPGGNISCLLYGRVTSEAGITQ